MACVCPGEAPRRSQQQETPVTPNLTDKSPSSMPSVSNHLLDTETVSDQANQPSLPSLIQVFIPHHYTPPTLPAYSTDSQEIPYSPTSISIDLET